MIGILPPVPMRPPFIVNMQQMHYTLYMCVCMCVCVGNIGIQCQKYEYMVADAPKGHRRRATAVTVTRLRWLTVDGLKLFSNHVHNWQVSPNLATARPAKYIWHVYLTPPPPYHTHTQPQPQPQPPPPIRWVNISVNTKHYLRS